MSDWTAKGTYHRGKFIVPDTFVQNLMKTFTGWHYSTPDLMKRTAFACVPQRCLREVLSKYISEASSTKKTKYAQILYEVSGPGRTRAEGNPLVKRPICLIRGQDQDSVATPCYVQGFLKFTESHKIATQLTNQRILGEAKLLKNSQMFKKSPTSCLLKTDFFDPHVKPPNNIFEICIEQDYQCYANLIFAVHTLNTASSDAGARFRDKQARIDAIRKITQLAQSILLSPKKQTRARRINSV